MRRSPAYVASYISAAPRLACVRPVASVHPEPGSNSSLYYLFFILCSVTQRPAPLAPFLASFKVFDVDLFYYSSRTTCLFQLFNDQSFLLPFVLESGCKDIPIPPLPPNFLLTFFVKKCLASANRLNPTPLYFYRFSLFFHPFSPPPLPRP